MDLSSDGQLVADYLQHKDESALEELVRRYTPLVFSIARRYTGSADTASDITQEAFVKAWKHLKRFDCARSFRAWIAVIAQRTAIDWLKKQQALPFSVLDVAETGELFSDTLADTTPSILERLVAGQSDARMRAALSALSPAHATIIGLYTEKNLTFREIAEHLRRPLNTVKSRYRRGIAQMRQLLADDDAPKRDGRS